MGADVQIEGVSEALQEGDRSALLVVDAVRGGCLAPAVSDPRAASVAVVLCAQGGPLGRES